MTINRDSADEILAGREGRIAGYRDGLKDGAAAERAGIVAWLRDLAEQDGLSDEVMGAVAHLAVCIERGEHARPEPEEGG